uniref:Uncharacterized protein n=1 Tax=Rhizophora mucronata TaxID=61149 RepID=A0A2P2QKD8_RHIMU
MKSFFLCINIRGLGL